MKRYEIYREIKESDARESIEHRSTTTENQVIAKLTPHLRIIENYAMYSIYKRARDHSTYAV